VRPRFWSRSDALPALIECPRASDDFNSLAAAWARLQIGIRSFLSRFEWQGVVNLRCPLRIPFLIQPWIYKAGNEALAL
jgi:hypothetical protein